MSDIDGGHVDVTVIRTRRWFLVEEVRSSCLGGNLVHRESRSAFGELHRWILAIDEPSILRSAFVHGIKRLPVAWSPPA